MVVRSNVLLTFNTTEYFADNSQSKQQCGKKTQHNFTILSACSKRQHWVRTENDAKSKQVDRKYADSGLLF